MRNADTIPKGSLVSRHPRHAMVRPRTVEHLRVDAFPNGPAHRTDGRRRRPGPGPHETHEAPRPELRRLHGPGQSVHVARRYSADLRTQRPRELAAGQRRAGGGDPAGHGAVGLRAEGRGLQGREVLVRGRGLDYAGGKGVEDERAVAGGCHGGLGGGFACDGLGESDGVDFGGRVIRGVFGSGIRSVVEWRCLVF